MNGDRLKDSRRCIPSVGSHDYRAFVGPYEEYDIKAALQFNLLTFLGLREYHRVLDVGCGSFRLGRLLIVYLGKGKYCGLDKHQWLVEEGIANEMTASLVEIKRPELSCNSEWDLSSFSSGPFDYVNIHSIFCHAPSDHITSCLKAVRARIHNRSTVVATFAVGDTDNEQQSWVYPDVVTYTLSTIRSLCTGAGFAVRQLDWAHPRQRWFLLSHPDDEDRIERIADVVRDMPVTCPYWLRDERFSGPAA